MAEQEDDEHISKKVVYEHSTSAGPNFGAIIFIVVVALAILAFIIVQMR
jgi:hypothetical protein